MQLVEAWPRSALMAGSSSRAARLALATRLEPDVVVIGGGINGLAIARDAALRGLRVVVVERHDIGGATSAISTRLIHGGLKYLERYDFDLVWESIQDRKHLLREAPHLVRPYPMLIPFYGNARRSGALVRAGVWVQDIASTGDGLPMSRTLLRKHIEQRWPGLETGGLRGGALFYDAQVRWAERLCVELSLDASRLGAVVLTHTTAEGLLVAGSTVRGVRVRDNDTGQEGEIRAGVTVNAAGPWVDTILGGDVVSDRLIGATKGSHVIVDPFPGAPPTCVFFEARSDGRPIFVLPWAGRYMLGSTDLDFDGDLDAICASDTEIDYLLRETNHLIPSAGLQASDVLYSYSGVRPLPYAPDTTDNAEISRGHLVVSHRPEYHGLLSIVGGKLTTHRALGEDAVNHAVRMLGDVPRPSGTLRRRFPGADTASWPAFAASFLRSARLDQATARRLLELYGVRARGVLALAAADPSLLDVFDEETGALAAEVVFAVECENAHTIGDVLLRRTMVGLNSEVGLTAADRVGELLAKHLGWSDARIDSDLQAYADERLRFRPRSR